VPKIAVTRWIPEDAAKILADAGEVKLSAADRPLEPDELRRRTMLKSNARLNPIFFGHGGSS